LISNALYSGGISILHFDFRGILSSVSTVVSAIFRAISGKHVSTYLTVRLARNGQFGMHVLQGWIECNIYIVYKHTPSPLLRWACIDVEQYVYMYL